MNWRFTAENCESLLLLCTKRLVIRQQLNPPEVPRSSCSVKQCGLRREGALRVLGKVEPVTISRYEPYAALQLQAAFYKTCQEKEKAKPEKESIAGMGKYGQADQKAAGPNHRGQSQPIICFLKYRFAKVLTAGGLEVLASSRQRSRPTGRASKLRRWRNRFSSAVSCSLRKTDRAAFNGNRFRKTRLASAPSFVIGPVAAVRIYKGSSRLYKALMPV